MTDMDIEGLIKQIYAQAKAIGACEIFTGNERTLDDIATLFTSVKGMEFCQQNRFPSLATFRLFKEYDVEKFGIYIDAGAIRLKNPRRAILIGRTSAIITCDSLERHRIFLLHGASANISASGWTVVKVQGVPGTQTIKNVSGHAIIL